jgi:hypothetical protein
MQLLSFGSRCKVERGWWMPWNYSSRRAGQFDVLVGGMFALMMNGKLWLLQDGFGRLQCNHRHICSVKQSKREL